MNDKDLVREKKKEIFMKRNDLEKEKRKMHLWKRKTQKEEIVLFMKGKDSGKIKNKKEAFLKEKNLESGIYEGERLGKNKKMKEVFMKEKDMERRKLPF